MNLIFVLRAQHEECCKSKSLCLAEQRENQPVTQKVACFVGCNLEIMRSCFTVAWTVWIQQVLDQFSWPMKVSILVERILPSIKAWAQLFLAFWFIVFGSTGLGRTGKRVLCGSVDPRLVSYDPGGLDRSQLLLQIAHFSATGH